MNPFFDNIGADVDVNIQLDRETALLLGAVLMLAIALGVFVGVALTKKL